MPVRDANASSADQLNILIVVAERRSRHFCVECGKRCVDGVVCQYIDGCLKELVSGSNPSYPFHEVPCGFQAALSDGLVCVVSG